MFSIPITEEELRTTLNNLFEYRIRISKAMLQARNGCISELAESCVAISVIQDQKKLEKNKQQLKYAAERDKSRQKRSENLFERETDFGACANSGIIEKTFKEIWDTDYRTIPGLVEEYKEIRTCLLQDDLHATRISDAYRIVELLIEAVVIDTLYLSLKDYDSLDTFISFIWCSIIDYYFPSSIKIKQCECGQEYIVFEIRSSGIDFPGKGWYGQKSVIFVGLTELIHMSFIQSFLLVCKAKTALNQSLRRRLSNILVD